MTTPVITVLTTDGVVMAADHMECDHEVLMSELISKRVRLQGLTESKEFNGRIGRVLSLGSCDRLLVAIAKDKYLDVKPSNLVVSEEEAGNTLQRFKFYAANYSLWVKVLFLFLFFFICPSWLCLGIKPVAISI